MPRPVSFIAGFNLIANMWVLKRYRPSAVAAFSLTTPIFGIVATGLALREEITWSLGLSALPVAGGIALATSRWATGGAQVGRAGSGGTRA